MRVSTDLRGLTLTDEHWALLTLLAPSNTSLSGRPFTANRGVVERTICCARGVP